jgi:hypothetical protein
MTSIDQPVAPDQPSDPAMFGPLSMDENSILKAHLTSGWYKQSAVYPTLSEPWQETAGLLNDLHAAWMTNFEAHQAARAEAKAAEPEPEAGL